MRTGSKLAQLSLVVEEEILEMETYLNKDVNVIESARHITQKSFME
jgi:hypothetical protein